MHMHAASALLQDENIWKLVWTTLVGNSSIGYTQNGVR